MTDQIFAGKTALVIGAGRENGIAFACAQRLAAQGASVGIADLPTSNVKNLVGILEGPRHSAYTIDVTEEASVKQCVNKFQEDHNRIDVALFASAILDEQPFLELTVESWKKVIDVNCTGMFIACQSVARAMVGRGGSMVCVSSNAGRVPRLQNASYGSSKAAVIHLVRCMALELAPHKIRVNALCPGSTSTFMAVDTKSRNDPQLAEVLVRGSLEQWRTGIPLGKLADSIDQANAASFLLSEHAKHITGQALCVDGGQTFF